VRKVICFLLSVFLSISLSAEEKVFHYYCTVADEAHFPLLMNLIGSIHKEDFNGTDQIAIFDIGLSDPQLEYLINIEKVKVYPIEKRHPHICTYFKTHPGGRIVRGWYLWKPVAFKQSAELFPYFLYVDAGSTVLATPDNLFRHIKENGYFIINIAPHNIEERITMTAVENIVLKLTHEEQLKIMDPKTPMIDAGFQGLSRDVWDNYIKPMYDLTTNISLFADDGTASMGFGSARHDQTLFSIFACLNNFNTNNQGWSSLNVGGRKIPFHMHWDADCVNNKTCVYRSRWNYQFGGDRSIFIRHKGYHRPLSAFASSSTYTYAIPIGLVPQDVLEIMKMEELSDN